MDTEKPVTLSGTQANKLFTMLAGMKEQIVSLDSKNPVFNIKPSVPSGRANTATVGVVDTAKNKVARLLRKCFSNPKLGVTYNPACGRVVALFFSVLICSVFTENLAGPNLESFDAFVGFVKESNSYHHWFDEDGDLRVMCRKCWFTHARYTRAKGKLGEDKKKLASRKVCFFVDRFVFFILFQCSSGSTVSATVPPASRPCNVEGLESCCRQGQVP
jgi:hypothetical protein